ncbi:hypothetical protein SBA4_1120005 [Candidatus Sulfopaludibacter sp. SbA4]|nr:hypothetical protein SBA4_1120005 [Candidatus Sulfopaludibacter sp. SbA4]
MFGSKRRPRGRRWMANIQAAGCRSRKRRRSGHTRDHRGRQIGGPGGAVFDILAIDPARIADVNVALTVFDGRIVYRR